MFLKMHRSKEKPDSNPDDEGDVLVRKVENLEELVTKRTQGLQEVTEQINQLSGDEKEDDKEADALFSQPGVPKEELLPLEEEEQ